MKIRTILIEDIVKRKILTKHGIYAHEIKEIFLSNPLFLKTRSERYLTIGKSRNKYITIVFEYKKQQANIITGYKSSDWQINLYKSKKDR